MNGGGCGFEQLIVDLMAVVRALFLALFLQYSAVYLLAQEAAFCDFELGSTCGWSSNSSGAWIEARADNLTTNSTLVTDESGNSTGRFIYFSPSESSGFLSSPKPLSFYAAPICNVSFDYRLPDDFSGIFALSVNGGTIWNETQISQSSRTCASKWTWNRIKIRSFQLSTASSPPFTVDFKINNMSSPLCGPLALDNIDVAGCRAVAPDISTGQPVVDVPSGSPLRLEVTTTGFPPASVTWFTGGGAELGTNGPFRLESNGTVALLNSSTTADSGSYLANASNAAGWASLQFNVTVYEKPFTLRPSYSVTVRENSNVTLNCTVDGFPRLDIRWLVNGRENLSGQTNVFVSGRSLRIERISGNQRGQFECVGSNRYGSTNETASVFVQGDFTCYFVSLNSLLKVLLPVPPSVDVSPRVDRIVVGPEAVLLSCTASGWPVPVVNWTVIQGGSSFAVTAQQAVNGFQAFSNGSLRIQPLQDASVSCSADNGIDPIADSKLVEILKRVDGIWSNWSPWSACSVTCGISTVNRSRSCSPPRNGGKGCVGNRTDVKNCGNVVLCPIDGQWSDWDSWGSTCSKSCGNGAIQTRTRSCSAPPPSNSGNPCQGDKNETKLCDKPTFPCPIDGKWSGWGTWGSCSKSCGDGASEMRTRMCSSPPPSNGGHLCQGNHTETRPCIVATSPCPVNGLWSDWLEWSKCSKSCGLGASRTRTRTCSFPAPSNGGDPCVGNKTDTESCGSPCPAEWSEWQQWEPCPLTCGRAYRGRRRDCVNPHTRSIVLTELCESSAGTSGDTERCQVPDCPEFTSSFLSQKMSLWP
eukprot:m.232382 g.232382  ORF g.232382 m.232382 type:complete len:812 (+) comp40078_c0_seq33:147-2582(+)